MSGIYTLQFNSVAATAVQDLFEVTASSTKPLVLLAFNISQLTELGDAAEEQLLVRIRSGQTTSGNGTAYTPVPVDSSIAAASFTAKTNGTTQASAGTIVTHSVYAWNVRMPLIEIFTQEQQLIMSAGRRFTLELAGAPADSITINGTMWVQEIG